jgi:polysaccharide export outer membrane protein
MRHINPLDSLRFRRLPALAAIVASGLWAQAPPQSVAPDQPPLVLAGYRLGPGDAIDVRLFFNPELNEQAQIRPDGRVSLQMLGDVQLAGLTVDQAVTRLNSLYIRIVKTPNVTLQLRNSAGQRVFVTGEVEHPGVLNLPGELTVLEAISEAGGVRHTGNRSTVVLIEKGLDGKPFGRRLQLFHGSQLTADAGLPLHPFDVVMVPESRISRLDRWVDQNIRQLIPFTSVVGFNYLLQATSGGVPPF